MPSGGGGDGGNPGGYAGKGVRGGPDGGAGGGAGEGETPASAVAFVELAAFAVEAPAGSSIVDGR
eukprot:6197999-Pleurochrysis_carterae.AAC.4